MLFKDNFYSYFLLDVIYYEEFPLKLHLSKSNIARSQLGLELFHVNIFFIAQRMGTKLSCSSRFGFTLHSPEKLRQNVSHKKLKSSIKRQTAANGCNSEAAKMKSRSLVHGISALITFASLSIP